MRGTVLLAVLALVAACRGQTSEDPPVHLIRNMFSQRRYDPMEANAAFKDGRAMRPLPAGVVARETLKENDAFYRGGEPVTLHYASPPTQKPAGVTYVSNPVDVTPELVHVGERRFATYCTPCHGPLGDGKSMVSAHGFLGIANLQEARIVKMPDGEIFSTITNGLRNMPSYASQIDERDRWAVIAYLRALQRSQNATLADVPDETRASLTPKASEKKQ